MGVDINNSPNSTSWSKNPMLFGMHCANYYASQGSFNTATLTFSDFMDLGEQLTIQWSENARTYTVGNPTIYGDPLILPIAPVGSALADYVAIIAENLRGDQALYEKYHITSVDNQIQLISRERDVKYGLTIFYPVGKTSLIITNTAISDSKNPNYALYIELLLSDDGKDYFTFTKSIVEPDEGGNAIFDVQEYLTSYLEMKSKRLKDISLTHPTLDASCRVYYKLRLAEMFGNPQIIYKATESAAKIAILGGVPDEAGLPGIYLDGGILKWMSSDKRLLPQQVGLFSVINFGEDQYNVDIKCRLIGTDESVRTVLVSTITSWKRMEKLVCPIVPNSLLAYGIDKLAYIELWLEKAGTRISHSQGIAINNSLYPYAQILLYRNSQGNFETIYTYGKKEHSYIVDKASDIFEQNVDAHALDATRQEMDIDIRYEIKINSGYFTKTEVQKFRDFILSTEKYILQKDQWMPVLLETSSIKESEDGNFLYAINFTLQYANEQKLWG